MKFERQLLYVLTYVEYNINVSMVHGTGNKFHILHKIFISKHYCHMIRTCLHHYNYYEAS